MNTISVNAVEDKNIDTATSNRLTLGEKCTKQLISGSLLVKDRLKVALADERGDVPGWVLVVLMTTGLVTAIWAIAKPNLTNILNNSLNAMNGVR